MKQSEFEKEVSQIQSIPTKYRNFETWGIAAFNWEEGYLIMTLDDEPRDDAQIEIAFQRDQIFITENCWDFFLNFDHANSGLSCSELKFFTNIMDILMNCEDDYPGKEGS